MLRALLKIMRRAFALLRRCFRKEVSGYATDPAKVGPRSCWRGCPLLEHSSAPMIAMQRTRTGFEFLILGEQSSRRGRRQRVVRGSRHCLAPVAQLVERSIEGRGVAGSIPAWGTRCCIS